MDKKTEIIITKFLTNEANIDELRQLELWISNPKNETLFFEYIKTNAYANMLVSKYDIKKAKKDILGSIRKEKRKNSNIVKYVAAAVFIGILASSYFFRDNIFYNPVENSPIIVNNIESGTDKATLTLSDGSVVELEKGESFKTKNANSNGEQIVYGSANKNKPSEIVYNYLTIPRGGQFFVKLSDGTQVWLNSESQLKYPVSFIEGETRRVELIYGEAYFDVSPSTKHKGSKFKILSDVQEIEVIGTEFNIKAYKDESAIYTTLVEGKVSVKNNDKTEFLKPNQQSVIDVSTNNIRVREVDVNSEISWINGEFIFYKKPLKEIMKVLSRWYDVTIIFQNKSFENTEFNGELGRDQKIEDVLDLIKKTKIINAYEINNNTIILK
ncbi:FecR family protein [Jejuia spongiicola]|uniref:FecR family protein n=1 Tax=Jejuia spongiicola TaxID=2942207 RepID=A0ABT0QAQ5_9FLAO|nr:FecR family protein [Jejuia spongiicola]MCL6293991.1 FecR family protein [Jejuia spongiicola]